jgi:DNA-directed RNA polymerase specialized sigma24 family protein
MTVDGMGWRVAALNREWDELERERTPGRWREGCVHLGGVTALGEVLDAVRNHPDEVLGCLVAECGAGDALAGRVVVQAMLPKMILMAHRDAEHDLGEYLASLWERILTYPLDRRPQKVAANLALDTLKGVKKKSGRAGLVSLPTDWSSPGHLARADEQLGKRRGGAARVLNRAVALGLIDDPAREVLSIVYLDGRSAAQAGRELGLSPEAVRARCSRAVRRLRTHASELADVAG